MQFDWLKRREFITLLGGATVTWPVAAYAQQPAMPMIAYLGPISAEAVAGRLRAFREGLKEIGYTEGENVAIRYRYAEDQNDQLPAMAIELARRQVSALSHRRYPSGVRSQGGNHDDPHCLHPGQRPGPARYCREHSPAGRQRDWDQLRQRRVRGEATGTPTRAVTRSGSHCRTEQSIRCRNSRNHGERGGSRCSRNGLGGPDPQRQQQQ